MANILKQSTQIVVRVGPFVDATDGVTPETGITLGAADQAEALKAAGAGTVDISAATWAAVTGADGWYDLTLTTSHTDTIGELVVVIQDSSLCLPVFARFQVVEETIYDALFAASAAGFDANQRVDVGKVGGQAASATGAVDFDDLAAILVDTSTTLETHLTDIKGTSFVKDTHSLIDILTDVTGLNGDAMRGTDSALLAASAPTNFGDLAIAVTTGYVSVGTVVDGAIGAAAVADIFSTTAITEAYAADAAAGTVAEILYLIQQAVTEFAISGTTKTIKKLDGVSTAATETLNDATNPTSITRAT